MSDWLVKAKREKQEWHHRRDLEHCYTKSLRENILPIIDLAKQKIEEKTRYQVEIQPSFSSIEVFVSPLQRKSEKLIDLHFKLRACHTGIFLLYGARLKVERDSFSLNPKVIYSKPKLISKKVKKSTLLKWMSKTANISMSSLRLTEYAAETEMKNSADCLVAKHPKKILLCCFFCRCLRFLRLM